MSRDIQWQWLPFAELTLHQLYDMLQLRQAVFVVEQQCTYLDADDLDKSAWHLFGYHGDELIAYCRVLPPGHKYAEVSIGRVLTRSGSRRIGLGKALMRTVLQRVDERWPGENIRISAQQYLEKFYADFGFVAVSGPYDEDGIPHVEMLRQANCA